MFIDVGYWLINFIHTKTAIFILQGKDDSLKTQSGKTVSKSLFQTKQSVLFNVYA